MIYSAMIRRSYKNRKFMYFLSRDGQLCFTSAASYHTSGSAINAARRKTRELMAKVQLPGLTGSIKFQVSK